MELKWSVERDSASLTIRDNELSPHTGQADTVKIQPGDWGCGLVTGGSGFHPEVPVTLALRSQEDKELRGVESF